MGSPRTLKLVFIKTEQPVFVGLAVRVLLQMPVQCGGTLANPLIFTGRVSHVVVKNGRHLSFGVGAEFFYSEKIRGWSAGSDS